MLQRPRKILPDNVPASQAAAPETISAAAPQAPALQPTGILQRPIANIGTAQAKGMPRASALTATRPAQQGAELGRKAGESPLHESETIEDEQAAPQSAAGSDPLGASPALSEDAASQPGDEVTPYLTDDQPSAPPPAPSVGVAALPSDDAPHDEEQDQVTAVYRGPGAPGNTSSGSASDWAKLKEVGQREREKREARRAREDGDDASAPDAAALALTSERVTQLMKASGKPRSDEDELASLSMEPEEDAAASSRAVEDNSSQMWKAKRVLRNHLDAVRAIAFDGPDAISASDDNTIKFWRLDPATLEQPAGRSGADTEPILTYRGHSEPVTCVAVSSAKRRMYSGSMDASVRVWRLPERTTGPYPPFEDMEIATLAGHTQAVWDMALLPLSDDTHVLATVSADGSVKIWNTDTPGLRLSWDYYGTEGSADADAARAAGPLPVPTSVSICHSNLRACAVSYSDSVVKLFEIETGRELLVLKSTETYGEER
jgi:striatin 1/3/4